MTLHSDLVSQAKRLATLDPKRPRQANLRRSVSSSYYALFHCLVEDGAQKASRASQRSPLWHLVARKFDHKSMRDISQAIASNKEWVIATQLIIPKELRDVADAFVVLQEDRHGADYDRQLRFTRARAIEAVERAESAIAAWDQVRKTEAAALYLLTMLLGPPRK